MFERYKWQTLFNGFKEVFANYKLIRAQNLLNITELIL